MSRPIGVLSGRYHQMPRYVEASELRHTVYPVEGANYIAIERYPRQSRRLRDCTKRQDETIGHSADEQRFWRPSVTRAVEFSRRRGLKHRQPFRRQFDIASDSTSPLDAISMWKRLHTCTPNRECLPRRNRMV